MELILLVVLIAALVVLGKAVKGEHKENPDKDYCELCVRWSECNGVDEDCPWRSNDVKTT